MAWLALPILFSAFLGFSQAGNEIVKRASGGLKPPPYRKTGKWLVSVIIPTKDEECYLPACLECLKNQTYSPIETVVVDYQSRDDTRNIARSYGVRLVEIDVPGIGPARDLGILHSSGEILVFLDADCIFEPTFIEQVFEGLRDSHVVTYQWAFFEADPICQGICMVYNTLKGPTAVEGFALATWRSVHDVVGPFRFESGEHLYWRGKAHALGFKFKKLRGVGFATSMRRFYGRGKGKPAPGVRWCVEQTLREEGFVFP